MRDIRIITIFFAFEIELPNNPIYITVIRFQYIVNYPPSFPYHDRTNHQQFERLK